MKFAIIAKHPDGIAASRADAVERYVAETGLARENADAVVDAAMAPYVRYDEYLEVTVDTDDTTPMTPMARLIAGMKVLAPFLAGQRRLMFASDRGIGFYVFEEDVNDEDNRRLRDLGFVCPNDEGGFWVFPT